MTLQKNIVKIQPSKGSYLLFGGGEALLERIKRLSDLRFGELMAVYEEGNRENGALSYPNLSEGQQILCAEQDFYQFLSDFLKTAYSCYFVLSDDGHYVAALRLEPYKDGLLLEALETKPGRRRMGYGQRLIMQTLEQIKTETHCVYSHISKKNLPSIRVHEKCGFQRILNEAVYIDGSVNDRAYTYCYRFQ